MDAQQRNSPGVILHPSQFVYAMQTVYSWSGEDVHTLTAYTESIDERSLGRI